MGPTRPRDSEEWQFYGAQYIQALQLVYDMHRYQLVWKDTNPANQKIWKKR